MDLDQQIHTVSSLYLILAVIGLVANLLQLRQMWIKKQHRSNCGRLFFSLAITDFLTALMFIILGIGILLFFQMRKFYTKKVVIPMTLAITLMLTSSWLHIIAIANTGCIACFFL